ncbi:3-oxoacyl-ACP reductase FabG [Enhygromyxa salina]|uniref:3-oxoacyl-[acyl-carrier-protein] reductase FabG n=1 Tax=Enhygromyxa salina TaxID=215803 RepID=A0A2S9YWE6_9BACT|nr:3-oxoacyl-ACP reductase FabG [Enhygromyxa salina]PRQ09425.1 3-oxoacyl-[acyl-carrier-protein] reductase FabG [Enhygromyxa salina]
MSNEQRVAIITGAANGIGLATAQAFAGAGYRVVAWDLAEDAGAELVRTITAAGGQASFARVDVSDAEAVEAAVAAVVAEHQRVDVLVNNAGILRDGQLVKFKAGELVGKLSAAQFDAVIAVNLKGVFTCTQAVAPHMITQGYGRVINASSVVGLYGNFGQTNYVAAKSGVIGMTKVWARELGRYGVTVNAIAPGFIATDMVKQMPAHVLEGMVAHTPVGRIGEPEDIARAYLFLADPGSGFISGTVLSVDGGMVVGT